MFNKGSEAIAVCANHDAQTVFYFWGNGTFPNLVKSVLRHLRGIQAAESPQIAVRHTSHPYPDSHHPLPLAPVGDDTSMRFRILQGKN